MRGKTWVLAAAAVLVVVTVTGGAITLPNNDTTPATGPMVRFTPRGAWTGGSPG